MTFIRPENEAAERAALGAVDVEAIRHGFNAQHNVRQAEEAAEGLRHVPLHFDDTPALTLWQLRSRARRFVRRHGKGVIFIDYLQLLRLGRRGESRHLEVAEITATLKALARELDVPVVALCQLARSAEHESDPYRMLAYLRESGSIEQDADIVVTLVRLSEGERKQLAEQAGGSAEDYRGIIHAAVAKNRTGRIGKSRLRLDLKSQQFRPIEAAPARPAEARPAPCPPAAEAPGEDALF